MTSHRRLLPYLSVPVVAVSLGACTVSTGQHAGAPTSLNTTPATSEPAAVTRHFGDVIDVAAPAATVTAPKVRYTQLGLVRGANGTTVSVREEGDVTKPMMALYVLGRDGSVIKRQEFADMGPGCGVVPVGHADDPSGLAVLQFTTRPAGAPAASYDVSVKILDDQLNEKKTISIAKDLTGFPSCRMTTTFMNHNAQTLLTASSGKNAGWGIASASADGTWLAVEGSPQREGQPNGYYVDGTSGVVTPVPGEAWQVVGNAIINSCGQPSTNQPMTLCLGTPRDPMGEQAFRRTNMASSEKNSRPGFCDPSSQVCEYLPTGDPNGLVFLSGYPTFGPSQVALVDPAGAKVMGQIPAVFKALKARYDAPSKTFLASVDNLAGGHFAIGVNVQGRQVWREKTTEVCGMTDQGTVALINRELVLLSPQGKRLTAVAWRDKCPLVGETGIGAPQPVPAPGSDPAAPSFLWLRA